MLGWIKNKLGVGSGAKHGFPQNEIDWLREDFAKLNELKSGIVDHIVDFITTSAGKEVLLTLAGLPDDPNQFCLRSNRSYYGKRMWGKRDKFFESTTIRDPGFHLRLAHTYEALACRTKRADPLPGLTSGTRWLESYLLEATRIEPNTWPRRPNPTILDAQSFEQMLLLDEQSPALLVRALLWINPAGGYWSGPAIEIVPAIPGIAEACLRHPATVEECLRHEDHRGKVHALDTLRKLAVPVKPFVTSAASLACSTAKTVRESAQSWLATDAVVGLEPLRKLAATGEADERFHAIKLLAKINLEASRPFLEERSQIEKGKKVLDAIQTALNPHALPASVENVAVASPAPMPELPSLPDVDLHAKLEPSVLHDLAACIERVNKALLANWEAGRGLRWNPKQPLQINQTADRCVGLLERLDSQTKFIPLLPQHGYNMQSAQPLFDFAGHAKLNLVHVFRWVCLLSGAPNKDRSSHTWGYVHCFNARIRKHGQINYRDFAAIVRKLGYSDEWLGEGFLNAGGYSTSLLTNAAPLHVWTYFADHRMTLLKQALGWDPSYTNHERYHFLEAQRRENAWRVLSAFPVPPPTFVPDMWEVAFGSSKTERPLAQAALHGAADRDQRIVAALSSTTQEKRAVAADWIARLKLTSSIPELRKAAAKEKYDAPKAAMLAALEHLGVPPDEFLDRAGLVKASEKVATKEVPSALTWFPFDQLPAIHWNDTGERVDPMILKCWLVQACKLKAAEASPLIRRYALSFVPAEREALGDFILQAWLTEDLAPRPRAEAESVAMQSAQSIFTSMAQYPQYYANYVGKTLDQIYAQFLPGALELPKGSANDSKGILAVAGACAGAGVARPVGQYLKKWYGMRLAQSKALLQMLAWVEHPSATQTLLAIGTRFRTKSLQEEATRLATNIATRKGWSLAELADRTVPSVGMDEDGILTLDYGPRQFTARLDAEMNFVLFDPEGKAIKALPDPRKDDDEALAAAAKKQLSASKKELKQLLDQQRANLYEAMCVERAWSYEDWEPYLNKHPVLRHFCQRLIWSATLEDRTQFFRPLADGTLTDMDDNPVTLSAEHQVQLAHATRMTADDARAWTQHCQDYEVVPLFEQLNRPAPKLTEEQRNGTELKDFEGWLIETFKLRTRATKLGYIRGETGDGGWFHEYVKRFPTTGLSAVIEFTGNVLPEENRTAAMIKLSFRRTDVGLGEVALDEVPKVLLFECWNDYRQMAGDGLGFDPEWQKKSEY